MTIDTILNSGRREAIERLLRPRSVVVVGASPTPGSLGSNVTANLLRHAFDGEIHLVNPKRDEINGRHCLRSVDDLPLGVDAAVLAIPAPAVLTTMVQLAARGVGAVVIFSAGFAEGSEQGLADQRKIAEIARAHGMIVEGPNCLGMTNYVDGIALTFVETSTERLSGRPGIGIVSQSGAMAVVLGTTLMSKSLGLSFSVSTGNEAASGVEDYAAYLLDDPDTHAIGMIVEQFRNPTIFLEIARWAITLGKPIVLLHPGRSKAAQESAATHTGAMAGDFGLMRTKVERAGVIVVDSLEELGDVLDIAVRAKPLGVGGTAVLTESGAFKALALDLCAQIGLDLPPLSGVTADRIRDAVPDFIPVSNPMDLTAQALVDPDLYRRALAPLLDDAAFGSVMLGIIQTDEATSRLKFPPIISAIETLSPMKPVIFAGLDEGAEVPADFVKSLRELGVPYFPSPERAFRAVARLGAAAARDFTSNDAPPLHVVGLPKAGMLPEYQSKAVLAQIGIRFSPSQFVTDLDAAQAAANSLGFPVVLKAQSPQLPHKSDAGGVVLGLTDADDLAAGWARLHRDVGKSCPDLTLDGVLVEAMSARGVELIVGARNDPDWGPVILVGFGGVQAEILGDFRLLTPDLTNEAICDELDRLKMSALLHGFRGAPALDRHALADLVQRLGQLLIGEPSIREIDLNPVVVYPDGEGVVALDALIVTGE